MFISSSGIVVDGHTQQLLAEVSGLPPLALSRRHVVSSIRRVLGSKLTRLVGRFDVSGLSYLIEFVG